MEAGSATAAPCPQVDPHPLPHNQIGGRPHWRWRQRQLRRRRQRQLRRRSPPPGRFRCSSIYSKNSPPSFILSGRPFFEVIAQGCNWIAVISATGNTKCCNLSINHGGPRQADPNAGERGGGLGFGPRAGRWAVSGRGAHGERRPGGARGARRLGGGLCICCSKCNKVHLL